MVRNDGKVLHIKHLALNKWLLPGGHCEREDNSLVSASLREIEEETGISSHNLVLLQSTPLDVDLHIIPANPKKERQNLWYHLFIHATTG
ncbi:NUDIX domain-containing protein [Shimazuella sp. KC615]|uniref:NUDIX domain-containing protein n=1 Tax=Shimazuella alba TaxID=2690964 RepID=A0A6I4VQA7_9BACL|nr:NUDIX domain-containing protein [Shimazuella alba]